MELLIVGAGAVGSTYGYLASREVPGAGAKVTYLIKPKHRNDLNDGIRLYAWKRRKAELVRFRNFELIDDSKALRNRKFDAVLITLPSDKFRAEGWLAGFLADFDAGSPLGKIWSLQPGTTDQAFLKEKLGETADARIVRGQIPILSYLAPLPGEPFESPGYAFYIPPGAKAAWSSKNAADAETAAKLFTAGGLPSKTVGDTPKAGQLLPEMLLRAVVAGLEKSDWSFERLLNSGNLHLVTGGMREMLAIGAKIQNLPDPGKTMLGKIGSSALGVRTIIRVARKIIPFDLESFLRVHFTKVEGQMHLNLDELIETGKRHGLSTTNLTLLRGKKKNTSR
jgi:2-dehydropantoate 2-reductase